MPTVRLFCLARQMPEASSIYLTSQLVGQFTSVDRGLKQEEARGRLEAALNAMAADDREVIAMRHFEALSTDEIAMVLDMTRSGVLKRYSRAIRRLTAAVGDRSWICAGCWRRQTSATWKRPMQRPETNGRKSGEECHDQRFICTEHHRRTHGRVHRSTASRRIAIDRRVL